MMQITRFALDGAAELDAQLAQLATAVATQIGERAVRAAADVIADAWITAAPYRPISQPTVTFGKARERSAQKYGHLRDNIKVQQVQSRKDTAVVFRVTTGRAFWAFFYEFGTVHQRARPTFRPAAEASVEHAFRVQADVLRAGIADAATGKA